MTVGQLSASIQTRDGKTFAVVDGLPPIAMSMPIGTGLNYISKPLMSMLEGRMPDTVRTVGYEVREDGTAITIWFEGDRPRLTNEDLGVLATVVNTWWKTGREQLFSGS